MCRRRPWKMLPSRALIAASASADSAYCTIAMPRDCPVSLHTCMPGQLRNNSTESEGTASLAIFGWTVEWGQEWQRERQPTPGLAATRSLDSNKRQRRHPTAGAERTHLSCTRCTSASSPCTSKSSARSALLALKGRFRTNRRPVSSSLGADCLVPPASAPACFCC